MSNREIISRAEANAIGRKRYYLGPDKPCKHGHDAERRVDNGTCVVCDAEAVRKSREKDPDKLRERNRQYREANADKQREYAHQYRQANAEKIRQYREANAEKSRQYREVNREKIIERHRQYRQANAPKRLACQRNRDARKLQATPGWFDKAAVEAIYEEAARLSAVTGIEHHVDHIIPLRGRQVCGLHVQNNLMAVPREWNSSKGAKLIEDHDAWLLSQMLRAA